MFTYMYLQIVWLVYSVRTINSLVLYYLVIVVLLLPY